MSVTIYMPRKLAEKHLELFVLAIALFFIGFLIGTVPEYGQPIIERAREMELDPYAMIPNFKAIFVNNGAIAAFIWGGWGIAPFMGLEYFPPSVMIYNVGAAFGAVVANTTPLQALLTLASFGLIEATGFVFALSGGLVLPKYVLMKITGQSVVLSEMLRDSFTLLLYGFIALGSGALLETLLINPITMAVGASGGVVSTFLFFRFIFSKD